MARLHGDGFDHYGLDETNLLDGIYAQATNVELTTALAATGTHSLKINATGTASVQGVLRKVLPTAIDKMGAMGRFYFPDMPVDNKECGIFEFLSSDITKGQIAAVVDANQRIAFYRGSSTGPGDNGMNGTLIAQSDPIVVPSAWNHIEIQVYVHDTLGWVRAAINGVHRYEATGLDTKYDSSNIVSVRTCRYEVTSQGGEYYTDDYALYDFAGNSAVDTDWCPTTDGSGKATNYIGVLGAYVGFPDGDTAEADWLRSAGGAPSYPLIGKTTPDDTTYLYATTATDLSEFDHGDLPEEITYIRGVDIYSRMSLSDAGAAMYRVGMKSVADVYDAPEIPLTVEPTYWVAQVNVDPDSGVRWTRPSYNASWLRMTRSA